MSLFSWDAWKERLDRRAAGNKQTERWFLQKLHGPAELGELAFLIAKRLSRAGKDGTVQVQSVWIDGLPQAVGHADRIGYEEDGALPPPGSLESVKCELADLLYVVNVSDGSITRERALLLQGKMAQRADRLPTGGSTKKERALLERHSWTQAMQLYRAHIASDSSFVGSYNLGSADSHGFRDYCRYLLISKHAGWSTGSLLAPYMTGWPQGSRTVQLQGANHVDLAQCALEMSEMQSGSPGMNVDGRQPEWDALISALRDGNNDRYMKGYGGQPYVRNSEVVRTADARQRSLADWFEQALYRYVPAVRLPIVGWDELYAWHGQSAGRPPPNKPAGEIEPGGFPLLPVITAIIKIEKG